MADQGRSSGTADPARPGGLLRQGLVAGWWTPFMDRHGPKNPVARFVVDLLPLLAFFGVLAVVALLVQD